MINCNTEKILAIFLLLDPCISNSASPNPNLNNTGFINIIIIMIIYVGGGGIMFTEKYTDIIND